VLDLTTILAGPFASYQLALFGADVIKIERPGSGDPARELGSENPRYVPMMGASFVAQNSGKRSIALDLKTPHGEEVFARLIASADVLLENMRPGVLERLGFSWQRLQELNPRLVYCAISGFGTQGPLSRRPAYDQIVQGLSGMAAATGYPDAGPLRAGYPIADTLGGYAAAGAICAALARRGERGCMLDVSMLDVSLTAMGWAVSDDLVGGHLATRNGNHNVTASPSGMFTTGDGDLNIAANTEQQFVALCHVLARDDLLQDPRFCGRRLRKEHRRELTDELEQSLARGSAAEWAALLSDAGVPAGEVLEPHQALEQEQVRVRRLRHPVLVRGGEDYLADVLGSGVQIDGEVLAPDSPPPLLNEHSAEILAELGYAADEIDRLVATSVVTVREPS
jgi:crotonobetainyl-CoA:carnitine CoA-transferase CaiB-like acyl-CoA transferase